MKILCPWILNQTNFLEFLFNPRKLVPTKIKSSTVFPFQNLEYWKYRYTVFRTFLLHALIYWAEILYMFFIIHMNLFNALQIKFECPQFALIFVGVIPLLELRILEIHSFQHLYPTSFDQLSWNFVYDFHFINFSKIQKNWCTVTVAPTIEHQGRHSRTPANQRWDQEPGRSQRLLLV